MGKRSLRDAVTIASIPLWQTRSERLREENARLRALAGEMAEALEGARAMNHYDRNEPIDYLGLRLLKAEQEHGEMYLASEKGPWVRGNPQPGVRAWPVKPRSPYGKLFTWAFLGGLLVLTVIDLAFGPLF